MKRLFASAAAVLAALLMLPAAAGAQTPVPSGTPWPPPTDVVLLQTSNVLNPDGTFVHPSERTTTNHFSWTYHSGFQGVFEVERAMHPYGGVRSPFELVATEPADTPRVEGRYHYTDSHPFLESTTVRCYRMRTVIAGETGPYTEEACTTPPITDGPGPGGRDLAVSITADVADQARVTLMWENVQPLFNGNYEVERAFGRSPQDPGEFERIATVAAEALHFQEIVPTAFLDAAVVCYRLRAIIDGNPQPYSEIACNVPAPHTGGPPPLPPDTGTGRASSEASALAVVAGAAVLTVGAALGALAHRRRL